MRIPLNHLFRAARLQAVLTVCLLGLAWVARGQPDVDGHPDSNAFYLIPPDTDDWTRHFHIGGMAGLNISGNFHLNGNFNVSGNNPSKGIFDDGYVREDQTGNAGGLTGFFGYNNASQYDASAQTLTMHATTGYTATESASADSGASPGFDMVYGANYWYWKHARVGWELGFDLLPVGITDSKPLAAKVNQSTYIFSTGGIVLPSAPYQGGSSGIGEPIIPSSPTSISTNSGVGASVLGSRSLNVIIYSVRLGPTFDWDLGSHVDMSLSAGPVLGVVSGEYSFNENINNGGILTHSTGSIDNTSIQYGGYFNATFMYHLTPSVDVYAGAQFTSMNSYSISAQGRTASLDLSGQVYLTAGISWPF